MTRIVAINSQLSSIVAKLDGSITSTPLGIGSLIAMVVAAVGLAWSWVPK